jgi:hypothetical protein
MVPKVPVESMYFFSHHFVTLHTSLLAKHVRTPVKCEAPSKPRTRYLAYEFWPLAPKNFNNISESTVKSKSHYDLRSVGQSVLVSSPIWRPRPDFCYCQKFADLLMGGALSDERMGLSFIAVIASGLSHLYAVNMYLFFFCGWGETDNESTLYVGHCWCIIPAPDDRWWLWSSR